MYDLVLPLVKAALDDLRRQLENHVEEFPRLSDDTWWEWAREIARDLAGGLCSCKGEACALEHDLRGIEDPVVLKRRIYRAILNTSRSRRGKPKVSSVRRSVAFPLVNAATRLCVGRVVVKHCAGRPDGPECRQRYEGHLCQKCETPFDPARTPMRGDDDLVIPGVYVAALELWRCAGSRPAHYYSGALEKCPLDGKPHGKRKSILWVRAVDALAQLPVPMSATPQPDLNEPVAASPPVVLGEETPEKLRRFHLAPSAALLCHVSTSLGALARALSVGDLAVPRCLATLQRFFDQWLKPNLQTDFAAALPWFAR